MLAMAPTSVMLMGLIGLLVMLFAVARITVLELRAHRSVVVPARVPAQRMQTASGI